MARYNWRKASIDEAIDRADKRKRRYTDKQRAAYWKKKYLALLKSRSR